MRRLLVVLLLAGCGGDAGDRWNGTLETLSNGAVRVTNPDEGIWQEDTKWRLVPALTLGTIDGPDATVFAVVSGLQVDDAGRIYVLDRQANELRIFAPDGTHIRSEGRSGGGPGEYENANGLLWTAPDTLLIVDQPGNRYTIATREGVYARSVPRNLGFYGWVFRGGYVGGTVYETSSVQVGEEQRPVLLGTRLDRTDAAEPMVVAGSESAVPGTGAVDTIALPQPTVAMYETFSVRTERAGMVMGVPFTPSPVYYIDSRGELWHGHGSRFRIVRSSLAGDTTMEVLVDAQPTPVTAAERDEWLSGESVKRFREMGGELDESRIPDAKPYFDDVYVDPDGHVWVSIPSAPMQVVFAILDRDGRYLGRVATAGMTRTTWVPPVVRNGKLHFVGIDEMDVHHVYVFNIERGNASE